MTDVKVLLETPFFNVLQEGRYFTICEPKEENGVVIAAEREDGRFLLARLNRRAIKSSSLEFPRGSIDLGETALEAACREFMEETGYAIKHIEVMGKMHSNTSLLRSHVVLTHAKVVKMERDDTDGEVDSVTWQSMAEFDDLIIAGEITDSHTLSSIAMLKAKRDIKK